jgi:hypothetical protein
MSTQLRLDVQEQVPGEGRWRWVVQATLPVRDLFMTPHLFPSRAAAVADFGEVCETIGWLSALRSEEET